MARPATVKGVTVMFHEAGKEAHPHRPRAGRWRQHLGWLVGGTIVVVLAVLVRQCWGPEAATAKGPSSQRRGSTSARSADRVHDGKKAAPPRKNRAVAVVNGEELPRRDLGSACLSRFGEDVLESLVNKHLITSACQQQKIVVSQQDVDREVQRMAERFRIGKDEWLQLLKKERGITAEQYAYDIIWPTLALRRLADQRLAMSPSELQEAYESQFGPAVKARLIAVDDIDLARRLHAQLKVQPDDFAKLAREHSLDVGSASLGGLIQPIRRHVGDEQIEQVVFKMRKGDLSPIITVGEQQAIFKCEGHIPAQNVPMASVQDRLEEVIRDRKLRSAADNIFKQLQAEATVKNIYNDHELRRQMPGVAATVNGHPITMQDLAEGCIARHGREVLEGEINKTLLRQSLRKRNLNITQADLDAEIAHAATLSGIIDSQGRPKIDEWIELVTQRQSITKDIYIRDAVWPSTALKKLSSHGVKVTDEDMQKGFEANYGPRVRCRAIVMSNLRRTQEVWNKARQTPTAEFFGTLAEEYSIEAMSRANAGEVPPIKRHSGQPILEKEAFKLQPNELSGIIQQGDKYVILFCEGYTKPRQVNMQEVREMVYNDLYEKKLRLSMSDTFERIKATSQIDNHLAGTSQSAKKAKPSRPKNRSSDNQSPRQARR